MSLSSFDESGCSKKIKTLISEVRSVVKPNELLIYINPELKGSRGQHIIDDDENSVIYIHPRELRNESVLSHELFHVKAKKEPKLKQPILNFGDDEEINLIVPELCGYIDHKWILAEQTKLGLQTNPYELFQGVLSFKYTEKVNKSDSLLICILAHIIRCYPKCAKSNRVQFINKYYKSYKVAEELMSYYPIGDFPSIRESREATIKSIVLWDEKLKRKGTRDSFKLLVAVIPVFTNTQMLDSSNLHIGVTKRISYNRENHEELYGIYTKEDEQCCMHFSVTEYSKVAEIHDSINNLILKDFFKKYEFSYEVR